MSTTCSALFSTNNVSGATNFTNCNFSGILQFYSRSTYYGYDLATIEADITKGTQRNIINVTV